MGKKFCGTVLLLCLCGQSAWGSESELGNYLAAPPPPPEVKNSEGARSFAGFYVGFGMTHSQTINEISSERDSLIYDNLAAFAPNDQGFGDEGRTSSVIRDLIVAGAIRDGMDVESFSSSFTAGPGTIERFSVSVSPGIAQQLKAGGGRPGGFLTFGYGDVVWDQVYLGVEMTVDFTGHEHNVVGSLDAYTDTYDVESCGTTLSLVFRPGIWCEFCQSLLYARLGLCTTRQEISNTYGTASLISMAPVLGAGIQTKLQDNFSMSLEVDWRLSAETSRHFGRHVVASLLSQGAGMQDVRFWRDANMCLKSGGYAARVMLRYQM
ncbi:MAG: hypothetical protein LBQ26_00665 [Holosporales bacterium]|jgi:hypothetical protein|nr:hypothetical protein [Holosporales bacterium]